MPNQLLPKRWASQPQYPTGIDWSNPITRGLVFACLPGQRVDSSSGILGVFGLNTGTVAQGSSIYADGTATGSGITLKSGQLLGPLQNSTVIAIANTFAVLGAGSGGISSNGNALYCERGTSGSDIYKLEVTSPSGTTTTPQFTYRNDAGTIAQASFVTASPINDGKYNFYAAVKNGTSQSVYCNTLSSSVISPASSAFTDATNQMRIGSDAGDASASWNGFIGLVAGWNRSLSSVELASLSANPWQIFAPSLS